MPEPLAYLNGKITAISQATLPIFDMAIVAGATVTETTRTFRHQPFRLKEHIDRLFRSLKAVGFELDLTRDTLQELSQEILEHNARLIPAGHDLGLVHFVSAGQNLTYLGIAGQSTYRKPTVCVHTFPLPFELWVERLQQGQHLVTPSIRHVPPECLDPKIKNRSRLHWWLADEQARMVDPQAVALLLDQHGNVTETSAANVFIIRDRKILTPSRCCTLGGISQRVVAELAEQLGLEYEERDLQVYDVVNADEVFTSCTTYCLLPVTKLNRQPIGSGIPGPIFHQLLSAWSQLAGVDLAEQIRRGADERIAEFHANT
jgi:branched-subunit amino acid aminotransferase/4-amino-4-deoxychorismate lyase